MATIFDGLRAKTTLSDKELLERLSSLWNVMSPEEQAVVLDVVGQGGSTDGILDSLTETHYWHKPLSMAEFLEDTSVAGPGVESMFPQLKKDLITIVSGGYTEAVLTGGIGWGKSWSANYGLMYFMHRIMCLREPQESMGLAGNSALIVAMLSTNREQAQNTILKDLGRFIEQSDFFKQVGFKITKKMITIGKCIEVHPSAANNGNLIGTNVIMGMLDEANFGVNAKQVKRTNSINETGQHLTAAEKVYNSLMARIKSRFMDKGHLPGVFFVVSSKNTEHDFTTRRIAEAQKDRTIFVADYPEWGTKPKKFRTKETFRVFFGGQSAQSRILKQGEDPPDIEDEFARVVEIPVDYRKEFEDDIVTALRDIAGVAVPKITLYFTNRKSIIKSAMGRNESVLINGGWIWPCVADQVPLDWTKLVKKHTKNIGGELLSFEGPITNPGTPRHIHLDLSSAHCLTGFTMAHTVRWVDRPYVDGQSGDGVVRTMRVPLIYVDAIFGIAAPPNGEINLPTVARIILALRERGYTIGHVSADQWQSKYLLQMLSGTGISTSEVSMDTTTLPYDGLKDLFNDGRISCPMPLILKSELFGLERDNLNNKVQKGSLTSKDVSDSLAGVCHTLVNKPSYAMFDLGDADSLSGMSAPSVNLERFDEAGLSSSGNVGRDNNERSAEAVVSRGFFHDL